MRQHKLAAIACLGSLLVCSTARTTPQDSQQNQLDTTAEDGAYQLAHNENSAQAKIKLLDDFVAKYPDSGLLPDVYRDYYLTYFATENYPQVIDYADKLVALGDKVSIDSRILALVSREVAYSAGCTDPGLRTPDAYAKATDAGRLGLQLIGQWQKPENLTDEQFAAGKKSFAIIFHGVTEMGESGLAGQMVICTPAPSPDRRATPPYDGRKLFDHLIDDLKTEQRRSPAVR
jgi:hypothetical protein